MALKEYRRKRDLRKTPEPKGGKPGKDTWVFVVQRHKASQLHYDFRLEMDGVLKSWAVPKGPSMDPADKRLAMMVEDHPYDYKDFHGVIPEGNYGAGLVEIWDHGTYEPLELPDGKSAEPFLKAQLKSGSLKVRLKGRKLKGEFALVRMQKAGDNAWLLIKHRDEYAVEGYDSEYETPKNSPINKALAKEAKAGGETTPVKKAKKVKKGPTARAAVPQRRTTTRFSLRGAGNAHQVIDPVKPMLASSDVPAFDDADWIFEIKWDGYRAIAETGGKDLRLYSRNGLSFREAYPDVAEDLRKIKKKLVLDGEIVAMDEKGRPNFQLLQHAALDSGTHVVFHVFDLLSSAGKDLSRKPVLERKALLRKAIKDSDHVKYCDHVDGRGKDFFQAAVEQDLEGIIGKRKESTYHKGVRSKSWVKIKNHHTQEAVIGGYTAPRNSRQHFGALLLGVYEKDKLIYTGHTGTGFDARSLKEMAAAMKPLERKTSPFAGKVQANSPATWLTPKLVANIRFTEWTNEGHMRHPVFLGLRVDKDAKAVAREPVASQSTVPPIPRLGQSPAKTDRIEPGKNTANTRNIKHGRNTVPLTNLNKVFWPKSGFTKGDVIDYYERMAPFILPHLKDRPQSLYRTPNGINGIGFFEKDAGGNAPGWVRTLKVASDSRKEMIDYILCNDLPTLLYLANLGCIEFNPWTSRKQHLLKPDHLVMDLDPSKGNTFDDVVEAALAVKVVLDRIGIEGFCKTSGSTGIHIYIPTGGRYTYQELAPVAKNIMRVVHGLLPRTTTLVRSLAKRDKKKIYLDHLQNRKGQTLASVYSIRPKPGATVSTPLEWDEVRPGLDFRDFTLQTVPQRAEMKGDLFKGVLTTKAFALRKTTAALEELLDESAS